MPVYSPSIGWNARLRMVTRSAFILDSSKAHGVILVIKMTWKKHGNKYVNHH